MEYGLIGEKLGHSFSKEIHKKIENYNYELKELAPSEIESFLKKRAFRAINVTIPYKETVIKYLDDISESALKIGAVNTIVNNNGKLTGYNTDYDGAAALLNRTGIDINGKKVLILGTGGTSKTMRAVVSDMGAAKIIRVSRSESDEAITYETAAKLHSDAQIIINTTPVGMFPKNDGCPIDIDNFPYLEGVADVVYNPLETRLIQNAKERGLKAGGGLYMLAAQAVFASALFTGKRTDVSKIEAVYRSVLMQKKNIVLTGMPSCGKSTIGKKLSEITGRKLYDTDCEIVMRTGKEISDIFKEYGESGFRKIEKDVASEISKQNGVIISTGGGTVLDCQNVRNLSQNSIIFFIDRSLSLLTATSDRPLSSNKTALEERYKERLPVYISTADIHIKNDGTVDEAAEAVKSAFLSEFLTEE